MSGIDSVDLDAFQGSDFQSKLVIGTVTAPPHFSGVNLNNGVFGFVLNGPAGSSCAIEVSPDLLTWTRWTTNTLSASGSAVVSDPTPISQRFYRAIQLP